MGFLNKKQKVEPKPALTEEEFMEQQNQEPVQQVTQIKPQLPMQVQSKALISGIEILPDGEYYYKVVANYPLQFGPCILHQ